MTSPFYSITQHFEFNFSWTVHHYEQGNIGGFAVLHAAQPARDRACEDQVAALDPRRLDHDRGAADRCWASFGGCWSRKDTAATPRLLVATIFVVFVLATLKRVADVTQVAQLGRYYMPVFVLALPGCGFSGILGWLDSLAGGVRVGRWLAVTYCAWSGPTRPGHMTSRGSPSDFSFTGRHSKRRRLDQGESITCAAPGTDHDLVSLGAAGHFRPDHDPDAQELPSAEEFRR